MLRRRREAFGMVYRQNAVVMSNHSSQVVLSRLERFKKKDKTFWDDVFGMLTGIEEQVLAPCTGVEDVYWCQNHNSVHWFVIEASISSWCFTIYDSDITVVSEKDLDELMNPCCLLFPALLLSSQLFNDMIELQPPAASRNRPLFTWRRLQAHKLTKMKKR